MFSRSSTSPIFHMSGDSRMWRRFSMTAPHPDQLIEIRRRHDHKTILRRRSDLPPSFIFKTAEWRSPL